MNSNQRPGITLCFPPEEPVEELDFSDAAEYRRVDALELDPDED